MTISAIVILNGGFALLMLAGLAAVVSLGLRVHRASNEASLVPAAPTPLHLHDELAKAA